MINTLRQYLNQLRHLQGHPLYLARGVSIGIFVGLAPLMPLKTVSIFILSLVLSGSMIAGIISCTIICNPFTYIPLYYCSWYVGELIMPDKVSWPQLKLHIATITQSNMEQALITSAHVGIDIFLVIMTGGMLIALPIGLASYPFTKHFFSSMLEAAHHPTKK